MAVVDFFTVPMTAHNIANKTSRAVIDRPYKRIRRFEMGFSAGLLRAIVRVDPIADEANDQRDDDNKETDDNR